MHSPSFDHTANPHVLGSRDAGRRWLVAHRQAWQCLQALALGLALAMVAAGAWAQTAPSAVNTPEDVGPLTQRWLDDLLARQEGGAMPLRMEVSVGTLDSRLRLAPCARVEPYLPTGARLWGRTRLGLRCVEGASPWNVFLPITVKAFGPAWVLTRPVPPGTVLAESDAVETEVDWAADSSPVVALPQGWVGTVAARYLPSGQVLRQSMVRAPELFKTGSQVKVIAQGPGYAVSSAGQALTAGAVGQTVRIRMPNGKVVSGIVGENGTVEVSL